jgi:16S rRNA (guanine(966)-N(2))-methyltransferase RsmD
MRVIGGEFRSRILKSPLGLDTRPTPSRLRESLFSILLPEIAGVSFLDAYAGSGAVGIEALSRGTSHALFVERDHGAAAVLRENLAALQLGQRAEVIVGKAAPVLARRTAGIVFLDPPYAAVEEYGAALKALAGLPPALLIVQHSARFDPGEKHGDLSRRRVVKQGENALTFYRAE